MTTTTDAKILFAHYCAGLYPAQVPVGLPDDLSELSSAQLAEICVARALGAHAGEREHHDLCDAAQVAAMVAELLAAKAPEPVVHLGSQIRLHRTGVPGVVSEVHCAEQVGGDEVTIKVVFGAKADQLIGATPEPAERTGVK